jgi:ribulose-phosphate 3-epimerase
MVKPVDRIIPDFAKAGANIITFHPKASEHVDRSLSLIRDSGCQAGLVFNPATPLDYMDYVMDKIDVVLLMSVNPGFGGQKFIPARWPSCGRRARASTPTSAKAAASIRLEIDGGVKVDNIAEIARAGADAFVAGSAVYGAGKDSDPHRYDSIIGALRAELAKDSFVGKGMAVLVERCLTHAGRCARCRAAARCHRILQAPLHRVQWPFAQSIRACARGWRPGKRSACRWAS